MALGGHSEKCNKNLTNPMLPASEKKTKRIDKKKKTVYFLLEFFLLFSLYRERSIYISRLDLDDDGLIVVRHAIQRSLYGWKKRAQNNFCFCTSIPDGRKKETSRSACSSVTTQTYATGNHDPPTRPVAFIIFIKTPTQFEKIIIIFVSSFHDCLTDALLIKTTDTFRCLTL